MAQWVVALTTNLDNLNLNLNTLMENWKEPIPASCPLTSLHTWAMACTHTNKKVYSRGETDKEGPHDSPVTDAL